MRCISRWIVALAACSICAAAAFAQDGGTLGKIKDKKTIILGVRDASSPFSFLDEKQVADPAPEYESAYAHEQHTHKIRSPPER